MFWWQCLETTHIDFTKNTTSAQQGSCGKWKLGPRGSKLVLLWHKQGPRGGSCWGPIQHSFPCSRSRARGISLNLHRPPAGREVQVRQKQQPNLFTLLWFRHKQDRKTISLENQQRALSSTFLCYENQEDSAQNAKRGNWDSHGRNKLVPIPEPVTTLGCVIEPSPERADHTRLPPLRIFRAFTSSLNPGLFPWQLSGELIKLKKKSKKPHQEQFEHTDSTFVTYQLTKLAALRFLVIKIDHVPATQSSLCHSLREKSASNNHGGEELQIFQDHSPVSSQVLPHSRHYFSTWQFKCC